MKGFLRSADTLLQLAPKITTIGREGCDITIQSPHVESQHAVIQHSDDDGCYVLQDLGSAHGTYVNDCRVQNVAVRLAPLDTIRFGPGGAVYQLVVQDEPPPQLRQVWGAPARIDPYRPQLSGGLPYLTLAPPQQPVPSMSPAAGECGPLPPNTLRPRPVSATVRKSAFTDVQTSPSIARAGWATSSRTADNSPTRELAAIQEREQRVLRMGDEVNRLAALEAESNRKSQTIDQLSVEVAQLRSKATAGARPSDQEVTRKLLQLEQEAIAKSSEVVALQEQILKLESSQRRSATLPPADYADKLQELHEVRSELEKVKKERSSSSGLVSQLQRDMSNKDSTVVKLTRDVETLRKEIRDRDVQLAALNAKFTRVKQLSKVEQEQDARDREMLGLRNQFKSAEMKIQDQNEIIKTLKGEMEKLKLTAEHLQEERDKAKAEAEHSKAAFLDAQRAEQTAKIDQQQTSKQHERFRSRVIQAAFSTPGVKYPDDDAKDDLIADSLRKMADERLELQRQLIDNKDKVKVLTAQEKKSEQSLKRLKEYLLEVSQRTRDGGLHGEKLKHEMSTLQALEIDGSDAAQTIKDRLLDVLAVQLHWQDDIESALEKCGIADVRASKDAPAVHIKALFDKWEASIRDKESLEARVKAMQTEHKLDLESRSLAMKTEMADRVKDAASQAKLEGERRLADALREMQQAEAEKRAQAVKAERLKQEQLEASMAELRQSIVDMQTEEKVKADAASENVKRLEEYKQLEAVLVRKLDELEKQRADDVQALSSQLGEEREQREEEMSGYKEQIRQHSVTICTMEERLEKATRKNKDLIAEITSMKQAAQEEKTQLARSAPTKVEPAPRPQIIIQREPPPDPDGLQQIIVTLRAECLDYKKKVQEQADVIVALRRDLAGAGARMQDMAGELSEPQKQELERNRALVRQKEKEAVDLQQQMAKLSAIVDKQSAAVKELEDELSKVKGDSQKQLADMGHKDDLLSDLQQKLTAAQADRQRGAREREEDGRVTQELCSLGAACRGERHQLVIERQREALTELRQRLKAIEMQRPGAVGAGAVGASQSDSAVQQVNALRKQLAELRVAQAAQADLSATADPVSSAALQRAVSKARGIADVSAADGGYAEYERSALRETLDALEDSEKSYLTLLRAMAACADMEEVAGLRSMAHLPRDERERLAAEREHAVGVLAQRVRALKERLEKKDELLRGYERDLAKLRQAELLVEKKSQQVDELAQAMQLKLDETSYLRETLSRTKDNLQQERRLNGAIKQKKTYHLEHEMGPFVSGASHRCPPEDVAGKEEAKKKKQQSKLRKQNYQIKVLREEVAKKEEELRHTTRVLGGLDSSEERETPELYA